MVRSRKKQCSVLIFAALCNVIAARRLYTSNLRNYHWICPICMAKATRRVVLESSFVNKTLTLLQLCLGANEVGERGANEVPKFILPTEPPPPPPAPTEPPAPTQRPAQPAPSSLAAVPPPAPAPHAGICSVHVSMYAQDSKIYSYVLQNKKCWHAGSCIYTQTNMHTQANCENANTRELEVEKEQSVEHNTNMIYINYKSKCKKSPKYRGHAD